MFLRLERFRVAKGDPSGAESCKKNTPRFYSRQRWLRQIFNMVNGYSGVPDMARLVNLFHLAIIALDVDWWGEWVPSKANCADLMTRPDARGWQELEAGLTRVFGAQAVRR